MKHNQEKQKRMSTFTMKQCFARFLADEFENCGFDIVLGFESSLKSRICTLRFGGCNQVKICINLGYVKKSVGVDGCSLMFRVTYCALFVAEYIKQIERSKYNLPQSYFEGLVFLNAIEVCRADGTVRVFSPLSHWDEKPKRSFCLRPLEISSAINALNKIRLTASQRLNRQEKLAVHTFCDSLLLYAGLPEVSYVYERVPVYALLDSFRKLAELTARDPALVREFPVLTLAPFGQMRQLTVNELFSCCAQSDNAFLAGVSIRLIAFLHPSEDMELADDVRKKLTNTMNQYIESSISYCTELPKSGRCLKQDNLYAVKKAVWSINRYFNASGAGVIAGNIHPVM